MIRCTIELIPGGIETHERREVIGVIEIANTGGNVNTGVYKALLKKSLPMAKMKNQAWRSALLGEKDVGVVHDVLVGDVVGFPRKRLGPYDLLYRVLKACGLEERNR